MESSITGNIAPLKIKIKDSRYLNILWSDNSESMLQLARLRKNCPCANCMNERLNKPATYIPLYSDVQLSVNNIELIGSYALRITWQDGHDAGIYTFDKLKEGNY